MKPLTDAWTHLRARPAVLAATAVLLLLTAALFAWGIRQGGADASTVIAQAPAPTTSVVDDLAESTLPEPDPSADAGREDPFKGGPSGGGSEAAPDGTAATGSGPGAAAGGSSAPSGSSGSSGGSPGGAPSAVELARAAASGSSSGSASSSGSSGGSASASGSPGSSSGSSSSSGASGSSSSSGGSSSSGASSSDEDSSSSSSGASARTPTAARPLRFSVQLVWPGARRQVRNIPLGRALPSTKRALFRIESANVERRTVRIALQRRARLAPGNTKRLKCIQRDRGRCALVDVPMGSNLIVAWGVLPQDPYREYRINVLSASRGGALVARARTVAPTATQELSGAAVAAGRSAGVE